jgi:hypothetical protein
MTKTGDVIFDTLSMLEIKENFAKKINKQWFL